MPKALQDYEPKIYLRVSKEDFRRWQKIPHGSKGKLLGILLGDLLDLVEDHPEIIPALLHRVVSVPKELYGDGIINKHKD